ncbi:Bleomycin hydrolase, partial [Caligus rogercresseyi]
MTVEQLGTFRSEFLKDEKNVLAQNLLACVSRGVYDLNVSNTVFTHKISDEGKPVSNQKASGRCWLFAALTPC